jgi:hypothetical protein
MKRSVALFGLIGLVGCFLPFVGGIAFFDFRHIEWTPIVLMTAGFLIPMIAGLQGGNASAALAGLLGFGYVAIKFNTALWDLLVHAEIGGKMMAIGAVGGLVSSVLALLDRERA